MFRRIYILLAAFAALLAVSSCEKPRETDEPVRVLLAYMGGDNNLSDFVYQKLFGLRDGWNGNPSHRIVAYMDIEGSGASLVEVVRDANGQNSLRNVALYGNENSASGEVFSRVMSDVRRMYPADSYGLLVFSHASGWLPAGALNDPSGVPETSKSRSVIIDGSCEMALTDLAAAIPDGMFDYIVFEACFMAGIEAAYELRAKTPLILASSAEIVHPGFAPVYRTSAAKLLSGEILAFGRSVFDYVLTYPEHDLLHSATYSLIRTRELEALAAFVRDNCDTAVEVDVSDVQHFDREAHRLFFDFEDYYSRLLDTDEQRSELSELVSKCVVWKESTPVFMTQKPGYTGFVIDKHSGLTAYIPQTGFPGLNAAYEELAWRKATVKQ